MSAATSLLVAQRAAGPSLGPLLSGAYERGLGLVVLGEWHSTALMSESRFFDDNTQVRLALGFL